MLEYFDILKNAADTKIENSLRWQLKRCVLESAPSEDDTEDKNGLKLMNEFLCRDEMKKYFPDDELNNEKLDQIDPKEFQKDFYNFLSEQEEISPDPWKKDPKIFIKKLSSYRSQGILDMNLSGILMDFSKKINNDPLRYAYELIQNADDCEYQKAEEKRIEKEMRIELRDGEMMVSYPEDGMTYSDIIAITTIGQSNKRKKKRKKIIGEKGIGFKTIFSVCDFVEIHSGPYHFKLTQESFVPEWMEEKSRVKQDDHTFGTEMVLHFKDGKRTEDNSLTEGAKAFEKLLEKYGRTGKGGWTAQNMFQNCPIMFTNKIEKLCIAYRDRKLVMKREVNEDSEIKTEIEKISYWIDKDEDTQTADITLKCIRAEKKVKFTYEEYISHYKEMFCSKADYEKEKDEIKTYPVILLAPVEIYRGGDLLEVHDEIKDGNVFTYLPTFSYINAPISIQIPFELNEDRSCMWISGMKGDDHIPEDMDGTTTKWNKRLFDEVFITDSDGRKSPCLLELAFKKLRDRDDVDALSYIPRYEKDMYYFFQQEHSDLKKINEFCGEGTSNQIFETFQNMELLQSLEGESWLRFSDHPVMFDSLVSNILEDALDKNTEDVNRLLKIASVEKKSVMKWKACYSKKEILNLLEVMGASQKVFGKTETNNLIKFVNQLIALDYEKVANHLLNLEEGTCCLYLSKKSEERRKLKIIKVKTAEHTEERWAVDDADLWIAAGKKYNTNNSLAFYDEEINTVSGKSILDLFDDVKKLPICISEKKEEADWKKDIWECIWEKINIEIECTFELFKELMKFMSETARDKNESADGSDWFQYVREIIDEKQSDEPQDSTMRENLITLYIDKYEEFREEIEKENGGQQ